jgi:hypothetical protein
VSRPPAPDDVIDAYLLGVLTDPPRHEVAFTFRAPVGASEFGLRARGVEYLLINEFLGQNIVHQLRICGRESSPNDVRELLTLLMFDEAHVDAGLEPALFADLNEQTASVMQQQKVLLEIEPVYGASVLMLAASIEWIGSIG